MQRLRIRARRCGPRGGRTRSSSLATCRPGQLTRGAASRQRLRQGQPPVGGVAAPAEYCTARAAQMDTSPHSTPARSTCSRDANPAWRPSIAVGHVIGGELGPGAVPRETDRGLSAISSRRPARSQREGADIHPAVPIQGCPDEPHRQTAFRCTLEYLPDPFTDRPPRPHVAPTSACATRSPIETQTRRRGRCSLPSEPPALDRSSAAHSKATGCC